MSQRLPARSNLEWLRKRAKDTLTELRRANPHAKLAEAQFRLAHHYGFTHWRGLVAFVEAAKRDGERLRDAVASGDAAEVKRLLDAHPALVRIDTDLDGLDRPTDQRRMSLAHLAIASGSAEVLEQLIAHRAPLDLRNAGGRTALHDSFELGRDALGQRLLAAGAQVDVVAATALGDHATLRALLTEAPERANDLTTHESPLGWAAYAHNPEGAALLLAFGATCTRSPFDVLAWRPACMVAATAVARVLLAHGADPNCADEAGNTPLHLVLASRLAAEPTTFVEALLHAGADPHRPNQEGRTALDEALRRVDQPAELYFPKRVVGARRLDAAIALMRRVPRR